MVILGLDFGTTFSSICVFSGGNVHVFKQRGSAYIPTYLYLFKDVNSKGQQEMAIGYDAEMLASDSSVSGAMFRDLKRFVGCDESNLSGYLERIKPSYKVVATKIGSGTRGTVILGSHSGSVSMEGNLPGLISLFVKGLVDMACESFKCVCTGIICSVPANYNCLQRSFTESCISLSGFACVYMINEPSAAALNACASVGSSEKHLLVYDFGGGTFDVSAISAINNVFVVKASGGDMNLGGRDVDRKFAEVLYSSVGLETNYVADISSLKESLSSVSGGIKYTLVAVDGSKVETMVTSAMLTEVMVPFISRTTRVMEEVFKNYKRNIGMADSDIKASLVLVGGSSYLPGLKTLLKSAPYVAECLELSDARAAVAVGCALYSSCLVSKSSMLLVDCVSHCVSIPAYNCESIVCVPAGAPIPFSGKRNINLNGSTKDGTYNAKLFEGDYVKVARNQLIFSAVVKLSDLGITVTVPTKIPLVLKIDVSSVGTITYRIEGPSGVSVDVGGEPAYNFSKVAVSTRCVADLHNFGANRCLLILSLLRNPKQRSVVTEEEKKRLAESKLVSDVDKELRSFSTFDEHELGMSRLLLGGTLRKVLRGSRVEVISV